MDSLEFLSTATLADVSMESHRAIAKHGFELSALGDEPDGVKLAILGEEFGEVCRALTHDEGGDDQHLYDELIQVSSVAAGWAQSVARRMNVAPAGAVILET